MPRYHVTPLEYDELCDLPTMMYFRQYAGQYLKAAKKLNREVYIIYFNLANFSVFNERYGFDEGDKLLSLTSVAIQTSFPGFLVTRVSEDHFLLVCESLNVERAILEVREQLRALGKHVNVELKAGIFSVENENMSIGLAYDYAKSACDSITHRYDRTYQWYDEALAWRLERKQYIESHIDRAIEKGWIEVYFQPIVRAVTGRVCEFEALARWNDPQYGLLSPAVFVDVLERARLIHKLDGHVVRLACEQWHELDLLGKWRVPVSVNLSRFDFELTDAFTLVDEIAREFYVPRQMLHIEVTESALNENAEMLGREVERFRSAGYQVWLDDFGSGYSSLNTLKDYMFDVVKIDMVFLREFDTNPRSRAIISSVVNMVKQLGMQTLIEGVETSEQFEYLRNIGCEFMQGFLIGRPSPNQVNVERIISGELEMEHASLHGYFDRIGRINSLSATPFDFPWDPSSQGIMPTEVLPLAVLERTDTEVRFMSGNDSFARALRGFGLGTMANLANAINEGTQSYARTMREAIDSCMTLGKIESVDLFEGGRHGAFRVRHIASHEGADAFLVSLVNYSRFSDASEDNLLHIALQYLYVVYDEVNIVDLSDMRVSTLYRGKSFLPAVLSDTVAEYAIRITAEQYVHPADRERYTSYMNMETVAQRVESLSRNYLADTFRMLFPDGTYGWATTVLVPMLVDEMRTVLVCVRQSNMEVCESILEDEPISKSLLWDTLLDLIPAGVFWKDRDRRFVGVSRSFLKFYNFGSTNEVLGKNDEDMGWHVNKDPFKGNELRVLKGESILNARGTCIARGEVHNIVASKVPLRRNGEVVGLLGYFTPEEVGMRSIAEGLSEKDYLTGMPNLRGVISSAVSYQEAYEATGLPYVVAVVDIKDMGGLNEVYGREFGSRIIKKVAQELRQAIGVSGAAARIGGDKFAVIRQVMDKEDALRESLLVREVIEGVHEVDGIRVSLRCALGWALNTEGSDVCEVLSLAELRMQKERDE